MIFIDLFKKRKGKEEIYIKCNYCGKKTKWSETKKGDYFIVVNEVKVICKECKQKVRFRRWKRRK